MGNFIGEVRIFGFNFVPQGWFACNGSTLPIQQYSTLFSLIGITYGGNATTNFQLPNIQGHAVMGSGAGPGLTPRSLGEVVGKKDHQLLISEMPSHRHRITAKASTATAAETISPAGSYPAQLGNELVYAARPKEESIQQVDKLLVGNNIPHINMQPSLGLNYCLCWDGDFPSTGDPGYHSSTDCYVGEIKLFAGVRIPAGWAVCDGRTVPISQFETLFALLGTTFGGNGMNDFALPDMRGRIPISHGQSRLGSIHTRGQKSGTEEVRLLLNQIPSHAHFSPTLLDDKVQQLSNASATAKANGTIGAHAAIVPGKKLYGKTKSLSFTGDLLTAETIVEGGNQPHNNMQPTICLHYIIAMNGVYPSRP